MNRDFAIEAKLTASEADDRKLNSLCKDLGIGRRMVVSVENIEELVAAAFVNS